MINGNSTGLSMFMQRNFRQAMQDTNQSSERLSTGKRLNHAADDVGAYNMSTKLSMENVSKRQALRNLDNYLKLYESAEGGIAQIDEMLIRMRELAIQASSETRRDEDRALMQDEFSAQLDSINHVARLNNYNHQKLLAVHKVDLGLLVDNSGSMDTSQQNVRDSIDAVAAKIESANINLKIGLAEMGDTSLGNSSNDSHDFTKRTADLGNPDNPTFATAVSNLGASSALEDLYGSLMEASGVKDTGGTREPDAFSWRVDTSAKVVVMITDTNQERASPAHPGLTEADTASSLAAADIEVQVIGSTGRTQGATSSIVSQTSGNFHDMGPNGSDVDVALNAIADDLVDRFGGGDPLQAQIGSQSGQVGILESSLATNVTTQGLGVSDESLDTREQANAALDAIDNALVKLARIRSTIAGEYVRMTHMYNIEDVNLRNQEIANVGIEDVDIAEETLELTTNQIRSNVGLASLSQARGIKIDYVKNLLAS